MTVIHPNSISGIASVTSHSNSLYFYESDHSTKLTINAHVNGDVTATNGTFSGDVTVGGTLSYDDVTNIDSVGVITARAGLHVTGGSVGIGTDNPAKKLEILHLETRRHQFSYDDSFLTIKGANQNGNPETLRIIGGDSLRFHTGLTGSGTERLRITSGGELKVPAGIGPQITFENQHGHTGDAVISTYDDGVGTLLCLGSNFYFSSGGAETRYNTSEESAGIIINRAGNIDFNTGGTSATATSRLRILSSGFVNIGNGYLTNSNSGLHVGRSSGGTAAGESVLAATLGNDSTMNNAIFTVKNAGNRGTQGHAAGSVLAKFEFNNGTAFEIDKYGRRTLPYQPAFSVRRNSSQDIPHQTNTKVQWNTEIFDVGGNFDSSTNYRFTAPVAGKYLFLGHLYVYSTYQVEAKIYKNGSIYKRFSGPLGTGGNDNPNGMYFMDIVDLSVNDFIEIFALQARTGDSSTISIYGGNEKETSFVGYFLG